MVANRKVTGKAMSFPAGLVMGLAISLAVTLVGVALSAYLIMGEKIPEETIGYCSGIILVVASMLGALLAESKIKRRRLVVCLALGGLYFLLLVAITALFFGGQYQGMGVTALLILAGSGCVGLLSAKRENGGRGDRKKYRLR